MILYPWAQAERLTLRPWHVLAGIMGLALALRLVLVLSHSNYLGVDGGAYLLSVQQVLGQHPIGQDFTRLPFGPGWLLAPFTTAWGYDVGYKIWAAVFSTATIPAMYLLLHKFFPARVALPVAAMAGLNILHAELLVTGALPLIGFALITVSIWAIITLAERPHRGAAIALALAIVLTVAVNMTSAGLAMIVLPVFTLSLLTFYFASTYEGKKQVVLRILGPAAIGSAMALTLLPWYMDVLPGVGNLNYPGPKLFLAPWGNWGWGLLAGSVAIGAMAIRKSDRPGIRALGGVLIVLGLLSVLWSHDEAILNVTFRGRYLAALVAYPVVMDLLMRFFKWLEPPAMKRAGAVIAAIAFTVATYGYGNAFVRQAHYSDQITTDSDSVLRAVHELDPESPIVVNTVSMAWWVQALYRVPAPAVWNNDPPAKWADEHLAVICVLNWVSCDVDSSIASLGARWVVIDQSFPERNATTYQHAPDRPWASVKAAPWLEPVFTSGDVVAYRVLRPEVIY